MLFHTRYYLKLYRRKLIRSDVDIINVYVNSQIPVNMDSNFIAQYEKSVHVNVLGAKGFGIYPYGDKVVLSAPTYNIHSFLIREVFDSWVGFNANNTSEISFIANSDVTGTIAYKTDYSGLMIVLAVIITSVVFVLLLHDKIHYLSDNFHTKIHNNKKVINNESGW